ncbi:prepilin-type processing-associated H-X9-DG domain-containing protein [Planctomicrobium piriforme]|uniref:Prepilin-type processing-associated H-X9-DG domain-containing protein n=1 Tax=Planctomicrobium piriforme TaxID=1576369 RepID=A0A1I3J3B5_9PLAN|nr:prepilin-type processing-associated H-X9-DG domain-containing protein [Planctomicrobium piriforme]
MGGGDPNIPNSGEMRDIIGNCWNIYYTYQNHPSRNARYSACVAATGYNAWYAQTGGSTYSFNSVHGKGLANMLLADGSVRMVALTSIDVNMFNNLCSRSDGNIIGEF